MSLEVPQPSQPENIDNHNVISIIQLIREHYNDELTGNRNRRWLNANLSRILEENQGHIGLLYIDLDGFKVINDALGHDAGDEHLRQTSLAFRQATEGRPGDEVVRIGGDEFLVILKGINNQDDIEKVKQRFLRGLDEIGGAASIGGVAHTDETAHELIRKAEAAMKIAKKIGKGEVLDATPGGEPIVRELSELGEKLFQLSGGRLSLRDIPTLIEVLNDRETARRPQDNLAE